MRCKPLLRAAPAAAYGLVDLPPLEGLVHRQRIAGLARHRARLDGLVASGPLADGGPIAPAAVRTALARAARVGAPR